MLLAVIPYYDWREKVGGLACDIATGSCGLTLKDSVISNNLFPYHVVPTEIHFVKNQTLRLLVPVVRQILPTGPFHRLVPVPRGWYFAHSYERVFLLMDAIV